MSQPDLPVHRLAVVALHPIQYQAGLWRAMERHPRLDVRVLYLDNVGVDGSIDPSMNAPMQWDLPLLEGYEYEFVPNWSPLRYAPIVQRINPGVIGRIRRARFDALVIHGHMAISNWLALAAAKSVGTKTVLRGEGSVRGVHLYDGFLWNKIKTPLQAFFSRRFDAIACSSGDNREYHLSRGAPAERLFPMPCAVDQEQLEVFRRSVEPRAAYRARKGLPATAPLVVSVTRFAAHKRPLDAVEAFARAPLAERRDVHLALVGDGPLRPEVEARVRALGLEERVHVLGFLNQGEMVAAVLASDLFVLASERDPSPKALSEATYLGLPVVCSDAVGTCRDFVEPGESGALFPMGDLHAFAAAIEDVLADPQRLAAMGKRSHEIATASDFETGVDSLVQRLDELRAGERR